MFRIRFDIWLREDEDNSFEFDLSMPFVPNKGDLLDFDSIFYYEKNPVVTQAQEKLLSDFIRVLTVYVFRDAEGYYHNLTCIRNTVQNKNINEVQ